MSERHGTEAEIVFSNVYPLVTKCSVISGFRKIPIAKESETAMIGMYMPIAFLMGCESFILVLKNNEYVPTITILRIQNRMGEIAKK